MQDQRAFASAWARFESFRENLPTYAVRQESITQYHRLLEELQASSGENLEAFKIPDDQIKPQPTGFQRGGYSGRPGRTFYTSDKRCDHNYFSMQMDGLWSFLQKTVVTHDSSKSPRQPSHGHSLYVENMYGSSIQQGSPGAVAKISHQANYQTGDPNLQRLLQQIKDILETVQLSPNAKDEASADVSTIEVQLSRPQPKASIITESLRSLRSILESAAGSILAPHLIHEITKYIG